VQPVAEESETEDYYIGGRITEEARNRNVKAIYRNHYIDVRPDLPGGRTYLLPGENLRDFLTEPVIVPELPDTVTAGDITIADAPSDNPDFQRVNVDVTIRKSRFAQASPMTLRRYLSMRVDPGAPVGLKVYETARPFNFVTPGYTDNKDHRNYLIFANQSITLEAMEGGEESSVDYTVQRLTNGEVVSSGRLNAGQSIIVGLPTLNPSLASDFTVMFGRDLDGDGAVSSGEAGDNRYSLYVASTIEYNDAKAMFDSLLLFPLVDVAHQVFFRFAHTDWDYGWSPLQESFIPNNVPSVTVNHGDLGVTHRFGYKEGQLVGGYEDVSIPFFEYPNGSPGADLFKSDERVISAIHTKFDGVTYKMIKDAYRGDGLVVRIPTDIYGVQLGFITLGLGDTRFEVEYLIRVQRFVTEGIECFLLYDIRAHFTIVDVFDFDYFAGPLQFPAVAANLQCGYGPYGDEGGQIFGVNVKIEYSLFGTQLYKCEDNAGS
jgi:hypothetical protein